MTIRRRLLLLLLPALVLLMLCAAAADRWIVILNTRQAYDQALAGAAIAAAAYLRDERGSAGIVAFGRRITAEADSADSGSPTDRRSGHGERHFYALSTPDGRLIAGSAGLRALPVPARAGQPDFGDASFGGYRVRVVSLWVPTAAGRTIVTVAETRAHLEQMQRVMLFGRLLVDFAELDLLLLLVWLAVSLGLRPLARLRDEAEEHSRRELRRFDQRRVPGELRGLVVAFNRVLELLHAAASAQRRFVADAAHQMRTPVAGLLAQIELLKGEAHTQSITPQLATLERAAQSVAHSANQLLVLARAEQACTPSEPFQGVPLEALVRDLVERNLERADRAGLDFGAETQPVSVAGDQWLLEDLLGNLIDNALKYTPRGGRVTVRCALEESRPYLEVEDDGPGIPEAERQHVRERFYRRPGSRGVGAGLGLAIVDEIARVHQASFAIGSGPSGRGARMRVRFACAAGIDITTETVTRLAV